MTPEFKNELCHSIKGWEKKDHKYIYRERGANGKWVYYYTTEEIRRARGGVTERSNEDEFVTNPNASKYLSPAQQKQAMTTRKQNAEYLKDKRLDTQAKAGAKKAANYTMNQQAAKYMDQMYKTDKAVVKTRDAANSVSEYAKNKADVARRKADGAYNTGKNAANIASNKSREAAVEAQNRAKQAGSTAVNTGKKAAKYTMNQQAAPYMDKMRKTDQGVVNTRNAVNNAQKFANDTANAASRSAVTAQTKAKEAALEGQNRARQQAVNSVNRAADQARYTSNNLNRKANNAIDDGVNSAKNTANKVSTEYKSAEKDYRTRELNKHLKEMGAIDSKVVNTRYAANAAKTDATNAANKAHNTVSSIQKNASDKINKGRNTVNNILTNGISVNVTVKPGEKIKTKTSIPSSSNNSVAKKYGNATASKVEKIMNNSKYDFSPATLAKIIYENPTISLAEVQEMYWKSQQRK